MSKKTRLSFEIFSTRMEDRKNLYELLDELKILDPDFISVACSTNKENAKDTPLNIVDYVRNTVNISDYIQNTLELPAITHLPSLYLGKEEVAETLDLIEKAGINSILALKGDAIAGMKPKEDFPYASDLVRFIKNKNENFKILGACYPDGHKESLNQAQEIENLKKKVDAGCETLVSQLFFDNDSFYNFRDKCQGADINVPILAGIMPAVNRNQILRLLDICKTVKLPKEFKEILEKYEHDPVSLRQAGLDYAVDQITDLVTNDVDGIHLFTMNQASVAKYVCDNTSHIFESVNRHKQQ
ncbi:MAG: methylenetetrahydrofolate reductase [NAD(P)H] [Gemella sp.]|nr:methylenetetrahydrofolate reductase [NAD(P)H] [Gemella sp.]